MITTKYILVGEDDVEDQFILEDYFRDNHFEEALTFQSDGKKVIEYLEGLKDAKEFPVLLLLDLNMPILNGTQTLFQLKKDPRFKQIPIMIYSTSTNEHEKRKCLSFGAVDYLVKPHTMEEGQVMVERLIHYLK